MAEFPNSDAQHLVEREVRDYLARDLTNSLGEPLELVRIEHPVPFGRIDILAWDARHCLVAIEVKRGTASREAIGQLQSYMGALTDENPDTFIRGILIATSLDAGAEAALKISRNIQFMTYTLAFSFSPGSYSPSTYDEWKGRDVQTDPIPKPLASKLWLPPSFDG